MTKYQALDSLKVYSRDFPKEALREIQANKTEYITELLDSLDYVCRNAKELYDEDSDYYLHTYAMYLLAEFREKKAFPYLIELLRLPEDHREFILGDTFFEHFPRLLLSTFDDANLQTLLDIIECPDLNEWTRSSALRTYEMLHTVGYVSQEDYVSYLRSLIYDKLSEDDEEQVFTTFIGSIIDTRLVQMIPDALYLYDNDRIDTSMYGGYDDFVNYVFSNPPKKPSYINDAVSEMEWWACFNHDSANSENLFTKGIDAFIREGIMEDRKQDQRIVQKQKKTGRNDPCPCGSGKKYKKCCYDLHQKKTASIRLEDKYDLLERYPIDLPLFKELYVEEAINIDVPVYKALHHRAIPLWVSRDHEQERFGKIEYLKEALGLFLDKCQREQITSFAAYDEKYLVHYRSYAWVSALIDLIEDRDPPEIIDIKKAAEEVYQRFNK